MGRQEQNERQRSKMSARGGYRDTLYLYALEIKAKQVKKLFTADRKGRHTHTKNQHVRFFSLQNCPVTCYWTERFWEVTTTSSSRKEHITLNWLRGYSGWQCLEKHTQIVQEASQRTSEITGVYLQKNIVEFAGSPLIDCRKEKKGELVNGKPFRVNPRFQEDILTRTLRMR